jgi:hypothetical protein
MANSFIFLNMNREAAMLCKCISCCNPGSEICSSRKDVGNNEACSQELMDLLKGIETLDFEENAGEGSKRPRCSAVGRSQSDRFHPIAECSSDEDWSDFEEEFLDEKTDQGDSECWGEVLEFKSDERGDAGVVENISAEKGRVRKRENEDFDRYEDSGVRDSKRSRKMEPTTLPQESVYTGEYGVAVFG